MLAVAYLTLAERKVMAGIQRRQGPNAVGFTLFFLGEYGNMIRMCGRTAVRFRGGWRGRPGRGGGGRTGGRRRGRNGLV